MQFTISYEDVKKLIGVFYNSAYQVSAPYVDVLHNLKGEDGQSFLHHLDVERAVVAAQQAVPQAEAVAEPVEAHVEAIGE